MDNKNKINSTLSDRTPTHRPVNLFKSSSHDDDELGSFSITFISKIKLTDIPQNTDVHHQYVLDQ